MKRRFALFLACVMLFSAIPVQAFAEDDISYSIEEMNPAEDANLMEDMDPTETVDLNEDIILPEDIGPAEGTDLSESTSTIEGSELIEGISLIEGIETIEEPEPIEETEETEETETDQLEMAGLTDAPDSIEILNSAEVTEPTEETQPEKTRSLEAVDQPEIIEPTDDPDTIDVTDSAEVTEPTEESRPEETELLEAAGDPEMTEPTEEPDTIDDPDATDGTEPAGESQPEETGPIEVTVQTEMTESTDDLETTDGTDLAEEFQLDNTETFEALELQEPLDLTESVSITLSELWYMDSSDNKNNFIQDTTTQDTISGEKETIVTMSLPDEADVFELGDAQGKLSFALSTAKAGDYFSFSMPACFVDLECKAAEENGYEISCQKQADESWQITVTLEDEASVTGEISLTWSLVDALKADEEQCIDFCFPGITEELCSYRLILPALNGSSEFAVSYLLEADPEQQTTGIVKGDFPIYGTIEFDEKIAGKDWSGLLRPREYDQPIQIVQTYVDSEGNEHENTYFAQEDLSHEAFYLEFEHDGSGAGSFVILNVPKTVTVEDKEYQVQKYSVNVVPNLPYYQCESGIVVETPKNADRVDGTLQIGLKTQTVTLKPAIAPYPEEQAQFPMTGVFTNTNTDKVKDSSRTENYYPWSTNPAEAVVPVGINYSFTQANVGGYRFDGKYSITTTTQTEPVSGSKAEGTIEAGENVTITTVNYAQNLQESFNIYWVDNNRVDRPAISGENFILQYKTQGEEGEEVWKAITKEDLEILDISKVPELDLSKAALNQYAYKGLPAVDKDGNSLSYRVVINEEKIPSDYFCTPSFTDKGNSFTFLEKTSFEAKMVWNDNYNEGGDRRPELNDIDSLNLYRKVEGGSYELVNVQVKNYIETGKIDTGNTTRIWSISIPNLPHYDSSNKEYDYVLIHGTIDAGGTLNHSDVENYRTYYNNGSGNYGNDTTLCHNGGTIYEVYESSNTFIANKMWKDNKGDVRPTAKVTLWQYVSEEASSIDDALKKGVAWPVAYVNASGEEKILAYNLEGSADSEVIQFDKTHISDLPDDFILPGNDDSGRRYVYFVKETLSGNNADNYQISYQTARDDSSLGAGNEGTIYNTRRQKAAVTVTKIWQDPSGLKDVAGTTVRLKIKAPLEGGSEMHDLQVYSSVYGSYDILDESGVKQVQTASGFTESVSSAEITYYVNIYDENGNPYDMTKAVFEETVTKGYTVTDGKVIVGGTEYQVEGNTVTIGGSTYEIQDGKVYIDYPVQNDMLVVGDKTYIPQSSYDSNMVLGNGITQYRYQQTNTVTGIRDYTLNKHWDNSITEEIISTVKTVNFTLWRRSTKTNSDGKLPVYVAVTDEAHPDGTYSVLAPGEFSRDWSSMIAGLPKYDEYGYEYAYLATEVSFKIFENGEEKTVTPSEKGWTVDHYRTPDSTTAINSQYTTGGNSYFVVSKSWQDNNDTEYRRDAKIRVYGRTKLIEKLGELYSTADDNTVVDLNRLTEYYEASLSKDQQQLTYIYYNAVSNLVSEGEKSGSLSNYIILEYSVGDGGPAEYTLGQLRTAANVPGSYNYSGTVSNSARMYTISAEMEPASRHIVITNSRTGINTISAQKTWRDEGNRTGARPNSIRFQLYQNGGKYKNIPDTVILTADGATVELNDQTGVVTLTAIEDAPADTWKFKLDKLPMMSTAGIVYTYDVEEIPLTTAVGNRVSYEQKKVSTEVTGDGKGQNFAFQFQNTITGLKSHVAYKYWQDPDTPVYKENRPDLSFSLYRYKANDKESNADIPLKDLKSWEVYLAFKDQVWTTEPAEEEQQVLDDVHSYDWKITVDDLPAFDEEGNQWMYIFTEWMNNNGETVMGTYISDSETENKTDGDTYEVFTNTISDVMTVTGKKTWTGLTGFRQVTKELLPDPVISLYRTVDPSITNIQNKTDEEIGQLVAAGTITLVDTTRLDVDKRNYAFPDVTVTKDELNAGLIIAVTEGENTSYMLPKFNSSGKRYTYLVRETIEDPIASQLYVQTTANGTLSNRFRDEVNRRKITVTKNWAGRDSLKEGEEKYHSVTYTLYRYEIGNEEAKKEKIESHKINANEFANGTASYTFEDLLIYSPTGKQYGYYIEEDAIDGYIISYTDESFINENAKNPEGSNSGGENAAGTESTNFALTLAKLRELKNNNRIDVVSVPDTWNQENAENNVDVSTTNTYQPNDRLTISGEKKWNDYNNAEGLRPATIDLKLYRYTVDETGQTNAISKREISLSTTESLTEPYILWDYGSNKSTASSWKYAIHNLERYAPNGMPYIYKLSEIMPENSVYQNSGDVIQTAPGSGDISNSDITNSFTGSYYVRKNWMDGSNRYNLRPTSITVKLQRAIADTEETTINEDDWQDIPASGGMPTVISNENCPIVSVTLTEDNVMENTRENSWKYTFQNLPMKNANGQAYTYRCLEVKIGRVPVEIQEDGKLAAGAYVCKYSHMNGKTTITNTLDSTSLLVTKQWKGDQDDIYHSRPNELTFKLQKKGYKIEEDTGNIIEKLDWSDVTRADGTPYTFKISKSNNWTKTLDYLPVVEVVELENGTSYTIYSLHFRAVEVSDIQKDEEGNSIILGVNGAYNYTDTTDYSDESPDHQYVEEEGCNKSTITNELILDKPAKAISVTKNWKRQEGVPVTATFELLYKTEDEAQWHCYGDGLTLPINKNGDFSQEPDEWSNHTEKAGCVLKTVTSTKAIQQTVIWSNLPKYDRNGDELEYCVVEHPLEGYGTETEPPTQPKSLNTLQNNQDPVMYNYKITNIELQSYTVKKVWQNTDYAEKADSGFTATFKLQQKVEGGEWEDVKDEKGETKICTLISTSANDNTKSKTWKALPKYTTDGKEISYRAVETDINGKPVSNNTNGSYIVTYQYDDGNEVNGKTVLKNESAFADIGTVATNRMVYGFVNLSKAAAYLAPGVTPDGSKKLKNVVFDIYSVTGTTKTLYASGIKTDENGNLIRNDDGTYGTEHKYLISGKYTLMEPLMEPSTNPGYSVWEDGVTFTVGVNGPEVSKNKDTGEHGTAWISTNITSESGNTVLNLKAEYKSSGKSDHTFDNDEGCVPQTDSSAAYNLESRGIIAFTKTGPNGTALDIHANATGESRAYFGVYTDSACTKQVAGMMAADPTETKMVLTTLDEAGTDKATDFCNIKNSAGIPYLRKGADGQLTLLSGTYYLKELVAPPGYKLDGILRKAIVPVIPNNSGNTAYADNKASIMLVKESGGSTVYNWSNTENQVTLYKRDQYGRHVDLGENRYLELKVAGDGNTFLTGENIIRLYQNATKPATKADGSAFAASSALKITYDSATGFWTIKGLFDIGKTYILSEPISSVPANNIQAKNFSFTMGEDGKITVTSIDAESKENPLAVTGDDYKNYYKSDSGNNVVVLRDVSRFLKDVALKKVIAGNNSVTPIENISFELYKYDSLDGNSQPVNPQSVLKEGTYLTTNANGEIQLSNTDEGIINNITKCDLRYGLDVGKYYFKEIERGASDIYRLTDLVFFEITPKEPDSTPADYDDYAKVIFAPTSEVSQSGDKTGVVQNSPVTNSPKSLALTKVDSGNTATKLAGAQFTLTYKSVNDGQTGAQTKKIYNCKTDTDGVLYLCNATGTFDDPKAQPDISRKGTYVLVETQASDYYMTRTPEIQVTFKVNSQNEITDVVCSNPLISAKVVLETGEHKTLELTAKNEKTVVSIAKRNDIENNTKTSNQKSLNGEPLSGATLEIYEGMYNKDASPAQIPVKSWTSDATGNWSVDPGTLKENTIYTLHESQAPVGYLPAKDIYFKLFGTTTKDSKVVSKLYVWTGSETPTLNGSNWSESSSIKDTMLTMVDEAIIAPVDLQKVVGEGETYKALPGAEFEVKSLDGNIVLGTAVSDSNGHLVWKTVTNPNGMIFNADRKRITADTVSTVIGKTIIFQQNQSGYHFKEIYAPDHAYNKGESFTVKITAKNYTDYRDGNYQTNVYVDILKANDAEDKTVSVLTTRENTPASTDLVNPPFKAVFELYKYDVEHPEMNDQHNNYGSIGLKDVEFTLYKKQTDGSYSETDKKYTYTTGENGLLHIDLTEKGTYKLVETNPLTGYKTNSKVMEFTIINEDYKKTVTYSDTGENHTVAVRDENESPIANTKVYDLPNERLHGTVTLTKQDANSGVKLNGVKYTLTRTDPFLVNTKVDKWFPSDGNSSITVETGNTYTVVASAADEAAFLAGKKDTGTSAPGVLVIEDLQWGTYTLVEQQENNGYILDTKIFTFTISADGLTKTVSDTGKEFVTNTKNQLTIQKMALDGTSSLSGAEFQLYPVTISDTEESMDSNPTNFFTTIDAQIAEGTVITAGKTTIYGLTKGTYVLRETKAPDGYELTKDVIFTMNADGTIKDVTTCTVDENNKITTYGSSSDVTVYKESAGTSNAKSTLTIKDTPIEVSLKKVDAENSTAGLSGARYQIIGTKFASSTLQNLNREQYNIIREGDKTYITLTPTADTGIVEIPSALLVAGETYTIREVTAPDSFELGVDVTITVNTDGTVTLPENSGNNAETVMLNADGSVEDTGTILGIRLQDIPIKVTINKTFEGSDNMDLTEGAVFKITPAEGSSFAGTSVGNNAAQHGYLQDGITGFAQTANTVYLKVTVGTEGENKGKGSIEIPKGLLKQGQSYILTEVATSTGYQLSDATNHITFAVGKDGVITFTEQKEGATTFKGTGTDALHVTNTRINFSIVKTSNETTSEYDLTNVRLTLTRVDNRGNNLSGADAYSRTWPTDEEIKQKTKCATTPEAFVGLAAGWYKLTESSRPNGYLQAEPIYFKVNQDNTVQLAKISESGGLEPDTAGADNVISQIEGTNRYLVTMANTLIRGHVKFTKVFANTEMKVQDAVFSLYKVVGNTDGDNNTEKDDIVIATGLRTDKNGAWTSVGNTNDRFNSEAYAVENASETDTLAKGLTVGTYYLMEIGCDGAYLDQNARSKKYTFIIKDVIGNDNATSSHYQSPDDIVTVDGNPSVEGENPIGNTPYAAAFRIWKTEDADHNYASISNAEFQIWYSGTFDVDADNHQVYHLIDTKSTDDNGWITKTVAEKGRYLIKETSNQGYEVSDTYYAFQLTDDQYNSSEAAPILLKHTASDTNGTLYLMQSGGTIQTVPNAKVNQMVVDSTQNRTYAIGDGIENTRKTIDLKLTKVDSVDVNNKLEGVQFDLYKKADIGTDGKPLEGKNPVKTGTTDGQGQILFTGLDWGVWGEYILVEKETIPGYHTRANISITLTRDLFTDPEQTPTYVLDSSAAANEQMKLKICKKNADGTTGLEGAVFDLYPSDHVTVKTNGTVTMVGDPVVSRLTTDTNGEVTLTGVLVGGSSYTLVETTPPKGYKVSLPVYFTVDQKGIISPMEGKTLDSSAAITAADTESSTGNYTSDNIITVKDTQIQIALTKKNGDDNSILTGAVFTVTGNFADNTTEKKDVTIENGTIPNALVGQLIAGESYTFTETTAPEGYELLTAVVSVDIYGQLEVKSVTNGSADSQNPTNVHTDDAGLIIKDIPIEVSITKNDMDETDESKKTITNNPATYELKPVGGSKFALKKTDLSDRLAEDAITTDTDGKTVKSIVLKTGNDGKVSIPSALLIAGNRYELTEIIAPEGYELATHPLLFTVNADGTLTKEQSTEEYDIDANDKTVIIAQDKRISIKINKKDNVNNKESLSGAKFKVTGVFAGETTERDIIVTVNSAGEITDLTGKLVSGRTYTFTETVPPQGYELDPAMTFVIIVNQNGSFTKRSGNDAVAVNATDSEKIDVTNQPVEVTIKKVDNDNQNKVLPQAVFTIKPDTNSDFADLFKKDQTGRTTVFTYYSVNNQIEVMTGADGTILIPSGALVINNTYVLTETKAPDGYELAGDVKFTVKSDGILDSVSVIDGTGSGSANAVTLDDNVVGLQVTDKLIDAKIVKVGGILETRLNDVKFTLEPAAGSSFAKTPTNPALIDNKLTLTTANVNGEDGVILIEKGILKQKNTYILKEIQTINGYYLGYSAKEGVVLYVGEDGSLSVNGKTGSDAKQKPPYKINEDSEITVTNPQTTKFTITKEVTGNMGDLGGSFDITLKLTEADGSPILNKAGKETTTVTLKKDETYNSTTDYGVKGIPVGATVEITEPKDLDYAAKIQVKSGDATVQENVNGDKGKAKVVLNPAGEPQDVAITLTNHKNVAIDVGVNTEDQAPWAALSLILPAIWLAYRYRRKRKGGEY